MLGRMKDYIVAVVAPLAVSPTGKFIVDQLPVPVMSPSHEASSQTTNAGLSDAIQRKTHAFGWKDWVQPLAIMSAMGVIAYGTTLIARYLYPPKKFEGLFEKRLQAVNYTGLRPDWAVDPVTLELMDDPVLIKTENMSVEGLYSARSYDEATVPKLRGVCALTRENFTGHLANTALKAAIEDWVVMVEKKMQQHPGREKEMIKHIEEIYLGVNTSEASFKSRLEAIHYHGHYPAWAIDPVTRELMEEPMILKTRKSTRTCTVDLTTIPQLKHQCPETKLSFTGFAPNRELTEAIDNWVGSCERKVKIRKIEAAAIGFFVHPRTPETFDGQDVNAIENADGHATLTRSM